MRGAPRVAFEDQRHIRRVNHTTATRGYKSLVSAPEVVRYFYKGTRALRFILVPEPRAAQMLRSVEQTSLNHGGCNPASTGPGILRKPGGRTSTGVDRVFGTLA